MATGLILGGLLACETPSPRPASLDRDAGIEMADRADSLVHMIVDPGAQNGLFVATNSKRGVPLIAELRELWGEANDTDLPPLF